LYYKQFIVFGVESKFHHFNSRRLLRMRKLLFPLPTLANVGGQGLSSGS